MADQLRTTEADLYERLFPGRDPQRWPAEGLGRLLQAPVSDIPTSEDLQREQGQIGVPTREQSATQSGQATLDYLTTFLGPLMALLGSKQYARQDSGKPARTWGQQADFTRPNAPLEQLLNWQKTKPWENRPPIGESAWTYRQPPQIGGPTGQGMSKPDILAAIEKEKFQGMLKQIRDLEAREALAPPPVRKPPATPGQQIDDDQLDWMIKQMWKQGGTDPGGPFKLPPLPGD